MIKTPQFRPRFRHEVIAGEGVLLLSEPGHILLSGRIYEHVAPAIDGRRTAEEIADLLDGVVSRAEVYYALILMERHGYIQEEASGRDPDAVFWDLCGLSPRVVRQRLAHSSVRVISIGGLDVGPMAEALQAAHVRLGEPSQFDVVVTDDYLRPELEAHNVAALQSARPWMLVKPVGRQILIGPVFANRDRGCWKCLAERLRLHRTVDLLAASHAKRNGPWRLPLAETAATRQLACGLAAAAVAGAIAQDESTGEAAVIAVDLQSFESTRHVLTRQPHCAACGMADANEPPWPPIAIHSQLKAFTSDGGHRVTSAERTLERFASQISPITGAIAAIERSSPPDAPLHVFVSGDNHALPYRRLRDLQFGLRSRSAGKGVSEVQAKASCLGEALERYSGVFRGSEPRIRETLTRLGEAGIHPNHCMGFSARQYDQREQTNPAAPLLCRVPLAFDPDLEMDWTPVWSLTRQAHRFLPTNYCYYRHPERDYSVACSNGCAAGNTLEEAILQGFLELVERDAVALWWYNRVRRPAVDLARFEDASLAGFSEFLRKRGRNLWVLDITSDLDIPVCVALSRRIGSAHEHIMMGFGAHLDERIAATRAVTELYQMLSSILPESPDGDETLRSLGIPGLRDWLTTATVATENYLCPAPTAPPRARDSYPGKVSRDLRDDILFCQSAVEHAGMELLVLDQTRADIGLPVAKVFVPGLRHFWPRFAPGRLYDVPVKSGWLERTTVEEDLNPIPIWL